MIIKLIYFRLLSFPAGCENGCSRHGQCTLEDGEYKCVCIEGWAGSDCSLALEMKCDDNIDNDHGKYTCKVHILTIKCNIGAIAIINQRLTL